MKSRDQIEWLADTCSTFGSNFAPQDEVSGYPEPNEEYDQADHVDPKHPIVQRHLLKELLGVLEVTIWLKFDKSE